MGWASACPPDTPIHDPTQTLYPSNPKSLLKDPNYPIGICNHPRGLVYHAFLYNNPRATPLLPLFAMSKSGLHADILTCPYEGWMSQPIPYLPWAQKSHEKLMWRGSTTGAHWGGWAISDWRMGQRQRLVKMMNATGPITVVMPSYRGMTTKIYNQRDLAAHYLDIGFVGRPIRKSERPLRTRAILTIPLVECDVDDGTCEKLHKAHLWTQGVSPTEALRFKYIVDVSVCIFGHKFGVLILSFHYRDGNAWSSRFPRLIGSGSVIFKSTIFRMLITIPFETLCPG
jgi:hypothetical protein